MKLFGISILLLTLCLSEVYAEGSNADSANQFFVGQEYERAAEVYGELIKSDSTNGNYWFRLGFSNHAIKEYQKAVEAYNQAVLLNFAPAITRYNLACAHSILGQTDTAFGHLFSSLTDGFTNLEQIETDPDLANVRSDQKYEQLLEFAKRMIKPCEFDPNYSQLDFWIGEWEVFGQSGTKAGENVITRSLRGCLVTENWASNGSNFVGQSINFFDPKIGKWVQIWNDNAGQVLRYEAELVNGVMHFTGSNITFDGVTEISRMTLTPNPDGTVEQFIEHSKDNGENWYTYFHGTYKKKTDIEN